ncbi:hypothetical protein [Rhodococcus sp. CX]|nr:hypothetical protein [Rhodococcus sp. CX]
MVDLAMQAAMIEPVDVLGDRPLDVSHAPLMALIEILALAHFP